jgi:hypothetical protein
MKKIINAILETAFLALFLFNFFTKDYSQATIFLIFVVIIRLERKYE